MEDTTEKVRKTDRTAVRRFAPRGSYDRQLVYAILDSCLIAHVGFADRSTPAVLPMAFWREGDYVYFHGQRHNRMLKGLSQDGECCFVVSAVDGLVLARRAVNHSLNYRSVVIIGTPEELETHEEKFEAMHFFVEKMYPGRWKDLLQPDEAEIAHLRVLRLRIDEASAKVRQGPPMQADADVNVWAGVVPIDTVVGAPLADPISGTRFPEPAYARHAASFLGAPLPTGEVGGLGGA